MLLSALRPLSRKINGCTLSLPVGSCGELLPYAALVRESSVISDSDTSPKSDAARYTQTEFENGISSLATLDRQSAEQNPSPSATRLWVHRFMVLLFVFFCATLGVVLVVYPWSDDWANNHLLFGHPALQQFVAHGFVRGLCSGLGLLDIWIGFWEAVHYHE